MVWARQDHKGFVLTDSLRALAADAVERNGRCEKLQRVKNQEHGYFELYKDCPTMERLARSLAYALVHEPVQLYGGQNINGIFYGGEDPQWGLFGPTLVERLRQEQPEICKLLQKDEKDAFIISDGGFPGHIGWRYDRILKYGVNGLRRQHAEALAGAKDDKAKEYYQGVIIALDAMLEWNKLHVQRMEEMLAGADDAELREKLAKNIVVMERVPAEGARNFHEALQSFYFQWLCVMFETPYGGNSPGRFDYLLWPYLEAEYEAGTISYQQAGELVAELFIRMDERNHTEDGNVNTIVLGGVRPDGGNAVSPLTYLTLDVFEQLNLTHPAIYTRYSSANDEEYLDRCVENLLVGGNRAQLLSDDAIIKAMTRDGRMCFEDAAMYMCGGCMEISPQGMNSDLLFSFMMNVPKVLELVITGGQCLLRGSKRMDLPRRLEDYESFEDFYAEFVAQLRWILQAKFASLDICSEEMARLRPAYLSSAMTDDCLARGRGQMDGGARYNDYGGTPLGIQNAADALSAIYFAVYEDGFCQADELLEALRYDFIGYENLRLRLLNLPKYGQGNDIADKMMDRLMGDICGFFDGWRNRFGGRVKPILFTFRWAPWIGESLGASADGRKAGQPIGHGVTPQSMAMTDGLTTAIGSNSKLTMECVSGGASTMWDMDAGWIDFAKLKSIVQVFLQGGGQIFQGNMTDVKELEKALAQPQEYPNLIVRVGGFSSRFMNLTQQERLDVVNRYRHSG